MLGRFFALFLQLAQPIGQTVMPFTAKGGDLAMIDADHAFSIHKKNFLLSFSIFLLCSQKGSLHFSLFCFARLLYAHRFEQSIIFEGKTHVGGGVCDCSIADGNPKRCDRTFSPLYKCASCCRVKEIMESSSTSGVILYEAYRELVYVTPPTFGIYISDITCGSMI